MVPRIKRNSGWSLFSTAKSAHASAWPSPPWCAYPPIFPSEKVSLTFASSPPPYVSFKAQSHKYLLMFLLDIRPLLMRRIFARRSAVKVTNMWLMRGSGGPLELVPLQSKPDSNPNSYPKSFLILTSILHQLNWSNTWSYYIHINRLVLISELRWTDD